MSEEPLLDAEALRRARQAAGLSQAQVARDLGLAGGEVVYNWERGRYSPREGELPRLARLLGVGVGDLLRDGPRDLRRLRWLKGRSVAQAAAAAGVTTVTYRRWEAGATRRVPGLDAVTGLARLFGVSRSAVEAAFHVSAGTSPR